ncbi:hypothetical protein ACHAXT_008713 [Thalassiosira profunda]
MAASPTFHSCPASTEEELNILVEDGSASKIEFEFRYELDTAPASSVGAAVERVEAAMLQSLAARSGLVNCAGAQQPWRHLEGHLELDSVENDRRSDGQRRLRGGRGSNSLVGLSSLEPDEILTIPCKSPANPPADPFDGAEVDSEEGFAGAVVIGNPGEASAAPETDEEEREGLTEDIVLASTRIDGKLQIERSIHRPDHSYNDGGIEDVEGVAFNYISTQSEPKEAHSHGTQNSDYPSVVPAMFRQGARMAGGPAQTPSSNTIAKVPRSANDPMSSTHIHIQPRNTRKCTVILGKMTAYSSNPEVDPFENIEGRLVAALEEELGSNPAAFQEIGGVRMHDSVAAPGAQISAARAYDGAEGAKYDALPVIVLVSLACVLVVLAGLFITTNRRGRKDKWDEDLKRRDSSQGTYHDDEVEIDALDDERDFVMSVGSGDDYSVGRFSVSSARDSLKKGALAARSAGSGGKRSRVGGSRDRSGIASARDRAVSPEAQSILTDLQVEQSTPSNGQSNRDRRRWEREDSLTVANRDEMPVQSSTFGLIATRPRAASPDSEIELEVHSVYDCDASVTRENDAHAHTVHRPLPDPNAATEAEARAATKAAKMGVFAGMFHKKHRGTPAMREKEWGVAPEPTFTYDEAERAAPPRKTKAALARIDEDAGSAATPNVGPGCGLLCDAPENNAGGGRSLLQFFAAREPEGARHAEVEASLRPFDGAADYSAGPVANGKRTEPVDKEGIFLGKTNANAGRALPSEENVENGADGNRRHRLRKFGDMIRRPLSKDAGDGHVNVAIQEVHIEAPPSPRRHAQEPRPVHTMQHQASSSPRRPVCSPSTLSGRRSRSHGGGLASSDALQENDAGWRVPAASWDAPRDASPATEAVPRIVARMEGAPPAEDDGSSAMQAYTPDMCGVGETIDCASPSAWWPDLFWSK